LQNFEERLKIGDERQKWVDGGPGRSEGSRLSEGAWVLFTKAKFFFLFCWQKG